MNSYMTKGTCSKQILFDVDKDNKLSEVKFIGGCSGNLQAVSRLVKGKNIDEVITTLKGIRCRGNTSCGDQLARALEEYKYKLEHPEEDKKKK